MSLEAEARAMLRGVSPEVCMHSLVLLPHGIFAAHYASRAVPTTDPLLGTRHLFTFKNKKSAFPFALFPGRSAPLTIIVSINSLQLFEM